jgi:hypothetical protein
MSKSIVLLNYIAFFILFITSFIFIFQKNASILGYVLLFITNTAFMVYVTGELIPNIDIDVTYFGIVFSTVAIISSSILHFVSLIFILMMIYNLHVKYTKANGLPLNIPEPYKTQLYNFNILMITTFFICVLLFFIVKFRYDKLDVNFYELLKRGSILLYYKYSLLLFSVILSIIVIVISSIQVSKANNFSKLSRQQVNSGENNISKGPKYYSIKDFNLQTTVPDATNTLKEKIGSLVNDSIFPIL